MRIEVVYAVTSQSWSAEIACEKGCTVSRAIEIASVLEVFENLPIDRADGYSIWGRVVDADYVLTEGDRLEVLRRLDHDPMQLRRMNANQ